MKYLCLIYADETQIADMDQRECRAYAAMLDQSGHLIAAQALQSVDTATTIRMRNGRVSITDGPFAGPGEQLSGFYLLEARDLNEALDKAARIPPARIGSIEVRPVWEWLDA